MDNIKVRLTEYERKIICKTFSCYFGSSDHLWIFGSRIHSEKRGGDIDLYIETQAGFDQASNNKLAFVNELWLKLGEQKIDVIIHSVNDKFKLPIYDIARAEGIQLV
jgi:hypothetical protein